MANRVRWLPRELAFRTLTWVQMGKGCKVRLSTLRASAAGPPLSDAFGETQFQDHVEAVVGRLGNRAEEPIDLGSRVTSSTGTLPVRI